MTSHKGTPPKVALIGVSGYATVYVDWLLEAQKEKRVQIIAVCAVPKDHHLPAIEKFRDIGTKIYESYEELFLAHKSQIDLCFIPTGIPWHARMTVCALRAGCNVLVEKPLAGSLADVEAIRKAERDSGKWVAVGFQDMYTVETADLKRSLVAGVIGKVEAIAMLGAWPRPESYYLRNNWAGKLQADGAQVLDSPLNNAFAHFVNLSLYLASPEEFASAKVSVDQADLYKSHDIESFDTAVVTATSTEAVRLWLGVSHASQHPIEPTIRILGTKGYIDWTREDHCHIYIDGQPAISQRVPNYVDTRREMFNKVLARLEDPKTYICSTEIAKRHTALIEQIHKVGIVQTVDPSEIVRTMHLGAKSTIPTIRSIENRLQAAFENLEPLSDIKLETTKA